MQLVNENMKLREMSMQIKTFDKANRAKQIPLERRFQRSIEEIENQKQRFMDQLQKVRRMHRKQGNWFFFYRQHRSGNTYYLK